MKYLCIPLLIFIFLSCKDAQIKEIKSMVEESERETETTAQRYPETLLKVFAAHGGLESWKDKRVLSFTIPKLDKPETHTIDLFSRHEKIEMPEVTMGYDGKEFWLADEKRSYKGDPIFYHNLMFYFYSMPFVLGDDGIKYDIAEELVFEGKSYPGIKISYESGVGISSKDEYFLYYNPETFQMEWLGYTVTYRSGEKSDNIKWIRYNDWMEVDDLILPKSITWHAYEDSQIKEPKNTVSFENVVLSEMAKPKTFFAIPENAQVINEKNP